MLVAVALTSSSDPGEVVHLAVNHLFGLAGGDGPAGEQIEHLAHRGAHRFIAGQADIQAKKQKPGGGQVDALLSLTASPAFFTGLDSISCR